MNEALREAIEDIRKKLQNGAFEKEEHIRLSLIARICSALGWDVWNPQEFHSEYYIKVKDFRGLVDVALFSSTLKDTTPDVFVDVKYLGALTSGRRNATLEKLEEYNRKKTATFTVLTDGQYWLFYDSSAKGELHQKHFLTIDLLCSNIKQIVKDLTTFLSKSMYPDKAQYRAKALLSKIKISSAIQTAKSHVEELMHQYPDKNLYEIAREYLLDHNQDIDVNTIVKYWDNDISPLLPYVNKRGSNPMAKIQVNVNPVRKKGKSKDKIASTNTTKSDKQNNDSKIEDNFTGTDVVSIQLNGTMMYPANWREVKRIVYSTLLSRLKNVKLTKWYGVSKNRSSFTRPIDLGEGYYAEGNLGAYNVVKHCY